MELFEARAGASIGVGCPGFGGVGVRCGIKLNPGLSLSSGADGLQLRRRCCDCNGILVMDWIALGSHWVTCGVFRMLGAAFSGNGDCHEFIFG